MMRVLEFLVALLIVVVLAVIVGVAMPGSGHIERNLDIGKDLRQVYDVLDNFKRFPDYSLFSEQDPQIAYQYSGPAYGQGAEVTWTGNKNVGVGKLSIASADPSFDKIVDTSVKSAKIVWNLENGWRGEQKHFTIDLSRTGRGEKLTHIQWTYDVDYGWNLISRFSNLYIHGAPDSFIQYSLSAIQNVLAGVPNVDYAKLDPTIEQVQATPVLLVSTSTARKDGDDALNAAADNAAKELEAAAKKLTVNATGPAFVYARNFGQDTVNFDVALPINSATLSIGGQSVELKPAVLPKVNLAAPASTASSGAPQTAASVSPGSTDDHGRTVVDNDIRATLVPADAVLKAEVDTTIGGVWQLSRDQLKGYAQTHGYHFDDVNNPIYFIKTKSKDPNDSNSTDHYQVFLPITDAPQQTPEQAAGIKPDSGDQPAASGTAPAPAGSTGAPAAAASTAQ